MLAVTVELDWPAAVIIASAIGSIVTFFVLFDRLRRNLRYYRDQQKKDKKALRGMAKIIMLIRHDQSRIMRGMPNPLEPSKMGDTGVFDAIPEGFELEELILPTDDEDDKP